MLRFKYTVVTCMKELKQNNFNELHSGYRTTRKLHIILQTIQEWDASIELAASFISISSYLIFKNDIEYTELTLQWSGAI